MTTARISVVFDMDIIKKDEVEKVMRALIKILKTQIAVAILLKISRQRFNYWLHHAKEVRYEWYVKMKDLLADLSSDQPSMPRVISVPLTLYQDERFLKAWRDFQHLPLHILFNALLLRCDKHYQFLWQPSQLKTDIALALEYDIEESLDALCLCGLIQKVNINQCAYGVLLCSQLFS